MSLGITRHARDDSIAMRSHPVVRILARPLRTFYSGLLNKTREAAPHIPVLSRHLRIHALQDSHPKGFSYLHTAENKNGPKWDRLCFGGERGIRTPGPSRVNGFQDHRFRPLSQLSEIVLYPC